MGRTWRMLWVSQHEPLKSQIAALSRLVPEGDDIRLTLIDRPVSSVEEIVREFNAGAYDDLVMIKPISMVQVLTYWNIFPLVPKMRRVHRPEQADVVNPSGIMSRFIKFVRVMSVVYEEGDETIGKSRGTNSHRKKGDNSDDDAKGFQVLRVLPVGV